MTRFRASVFAAAWLCAVATAQANPALEQLLDTVRQAQSNERQALRDLEREFIERQDSASQLLAEATAQRRKAEQESQDLRDQLRELDAALAQAQAQITREAGDLAQLGQVSRLVAAELRDRLRNSPTSIERPRRHATLSGLAEQTGLPTPQQLQILWETLLDDINLTGAISAVQFPVTAADGTERVRDVLRIGSLLLISAGDYLQYLPASGSLLVSPRQPGLALRAQAREFQAGSVDTLAIDPSQGQALRLAGSDRDWRTRLAQGGMIGYTIVALAVLALLISLERLLVLYLTGKKLARERDGRGAGVNPLARLRAIGANDTDTETLGLKLDEAVLRELPRLKRGLSTLSVLGASAPLLGLLGTVAGMIQTFSVISVFGNSDPKLLSAGISQALVTTELGLLAAIPILLLHSYLNAQSNRLVQVLDEESAALLADCAERRHARLA